MNHLVRVPINLGCCSEAPRCALCPAPTAHLTPDGVRAMVDAYRRDRAGDRPLSVGFYGGPPPSDDLIDAIDRLPFTARVRPDLLSRAEAARLAGRGAIAVEIDLLTFDDTVLRGVGRHYRGEIARPIAEGLGAFGVSAGVVLAPGLPGGSFDASLRDAMAAADLFDFARLHPALVLDGSRLHDRYRAGAFAPLSVGDAVTVCRAMMDVLEASGVDVIRVGVQSGPDEAGRVIAGPAHSSLRELVEARRTLDRLRGALDEIPAGAHIEIRCAPPDETRTRGPMNQHLRTLRAEFGFEDVRVSVDAELERGNIEIAIIA